MEEVYLKIEKYYQEQHEEVCKRLRKWQNTTYCDEQLKFDLMDFAECKHIQSYSTLFNKIKRRLKDDPENLSKVETIVAPLDLKDSKTFTKKNVEKIQKKLKHKLK